MNVKNRILRGLILLNSFRLNLKFFDFKKALKVPIYFPLHTKIYGAYKGALVLDSENIYRCMIQLGKNEGVSGILSDKNATLYFGKESKIIFHGKVDLGRGMSIRVYDNAVLEIGNDLKANQNLSVHCTKKILIRNNVLCGWNVTIRDNDGHNIYEKNNMNLLNPASEICIGNEVWIGAHASVFKGVTIGDGTVIGGHSVVTKDVAASSLAVGIPAKIIRNNIVWER